MLALKLAFRNILAHWYRSIIIFFSLSLVSCFLFLFLSFSDGEIKNFKEGVIALTQPPSDIVVNTKGYRSCIEGTNDFKIASEYSILDTKEIQEGLSELIKNSEVAVNNPMLHLDMVVSGERFLGFNLKSVEVGNDWQVAPYIEIEKGQWFDNNNTPQILLHHNAAYGMIFKPGDTVFLTGNDLFGQVIYQEVVIKGTFKPLIDDPRLNSLVFINSDGYMIASGLNKNESFEISIKIDGKANKKDLIEIMEIWNNENGYNITFYDSDNIKRVDGGIYEMVRIIFLIVTILISIVVIYGVMSVVSVNLFDRKKEIGVYYCLGSDKSFLVMLYTFEVLILNSFSSISGIFLGMMIRLLINSFGISTDDPGMQIVLGGSRFTLGLNINSSLYLLGLIIILSILTSLIVLRTRLNVRPIEAVKEID